MKIFVIGAGQVGATVVEALHDEHELTVIDLDEERLAAIAQRYDVATVEGNGASRRVLSTAGITETDLLIACTSRDEANIVSAMISKACSKRTTTVVRTTNPEYLEVWREGQLDVDFIVSSEVETAHAISRTIGVPTARQTDVFAGGQVQIVEFDVTDKANPALLGVPLREATIPPDSRVAAIIRGEQVVMPRGDETIQLGDRIVVIGSPQAAQQWGELIAPGTGKVTDVVIFGAGRAGTAIARLLLEQGIGVRLIESSREQARLVAAELEGARVYHATGFDPDFLERERIADAQVAIFAMRDDMKNHFAAALAEGARRPLRDRDRARHDLGGGLRAGGHRHHRQPAPDHGRGDRPLRPRPAHAAGRDARRRPLRGARHHDPSRERVRGHALQGHADPGRVDRCDRARRDSRLPARGRRPPGRRPRDHLHRVPARAGGREGAVSPAERGRPGRRAPRLAVDVVGALHVVATLLAYLSLSVLMPAAVAIGYSEQVWPFLAAGAITGGIAAAVAYATRGEHRLGVREGFLVVALTWLAAAAFAALPYVFSGDPQLDRPVDAFFEGMSGFSTTGGSVVTQVEELPRSLALWRQFTQWLGGIGIIVLALAVLPRLRVGGRQLLEHEMPGPEIETLSTRIRDTARRVWVLYIGLTVVLFGLLLALWASGVDEEMSPYQAFAHALTTIPTAGFSTKADSIEGFAPATQWLLVVFMVLGGFNFALMYRALVRRQPRALVRDGEARLYMALLALGSVILVTEVLTEDVLVGMDGIRVAVFTAVSTMTTTGFSVADYNTWPALAMMTIVGLMFVGGSAGSTTGSVKVVRHLLLGKILRREIDQTLHPELVVPVRLNRRVVDERTLRAISSFILLYIGIFIVGAAALAIDAARTGLALSPFDAVSVSASMLAQRRPRLRGRRPAGLVRALQRLLHAADERPDVARPARDRPDRRARLAPLLAQRLARQ